MSAYFDFHFHPLFKQFMSDYETAYPGARSADSLIPSVVPSKAVLRWMDNGMLHMIGSQASIEEIKHIDETMGVANVVSLEYALASATNLFGKLLSDGAAAPLDRNYFDKVHNGTISYYHLFIKELRLYGVLANTGTFSKPGTTSVINIIARSKRDKKSFDKYAGISLALSMEGGHNLNRTLINKDNSTANLDKPGGLRPALTDAIYADFYDNAGTLLSPAQSLTNLFHAMWKEEMDLLYVTLTHLSDITELRLATHAYGMKILRHPKFLPAGNGLTDEGKAVIEAAYGMSVDGRKTPVFIDIKHMSLKSRLDFYAYRKEKGHTVPILATHVGVTGYSIAEWLSADAKDLGDGTTRVTAPPKMMGYERPDDLTKLPYYANPWVINMMDDDIIEVLKSGGMIGISFDKRIVGAIATGLNPVNDGPDKANSPIPADLVATEEYAYIKANIAKTPLAAIPEEDADSNFDVDPDRTKNSAERDKLRELACFAFNVTHILGVGARAGIDAWTRVVLGSDYDGFVEPLALANFCKDIAEQDVENLVLNMMPGIERSYLHYHPTGGKTLLPRTASGDIDMEALKIKMHGVFYTNGKSFLEKWYKS